MYGVHIGPGKTSARVHRCISTLLYREVIIDHRRRTDIYPGAVWTYGNKRVLSCHDVNEAWSLWHSLFMSIINHHAPMKSKRIRGDSLPWLDGKILQLMRQRDCAHKIAKRSGSHTETNPVRTEPLVFFWSEIYMYAISGKVCEYDFKSVYY